MLRTRHGEAEQKVRVLTPPSAAEDALTVRRYLSTAFVAHAKRIWGSRGMTRQALAQAEAWIGEFGTPPGDAVPLRRRQLITLSTLERRLVDLSAAATQGAGVILLDEADAELSPDSLAELGTVCDRLVQASGSTIILVGGTLRSPARTAGPASDAQPPLEIEPDGEPTVEPSVDGQKAPAADVVSADAGAAEPPTHAPESHDAAEDEELDLDHRPRRGAGLSEGAP